MHVKKPVVIATQIPALENLAVAYFDERKRADEVFRAGRSEAQKISADAHESFHDGLNKWLVENGHATEAELADKSRQFTYEEGVIFEVTPEAPAPQAQDAEASATLN